MKKVLVGIVVTLVAITLFGCASVHVISTEDTLPEVYENYYSLQ